VAPLSCVQTCFELPVLKGLVSMVLYLKEKELKKKKSRVATIDIQPDRFYGFLLPTLKCLTVLPCGSSGRVHSLWAYKQEAESIFV